MLQINSDIVAKFAKSKCGIRAFSWMRTLCPLLKTERDDEAVITIITGPVNSGKTTKMAAVYREMGAGDGFILPKVFIEGKYAGQNILQLSTGMTKSFSLADRRFPKDQEAFRYRNYSFCIEGQNFAEGIVNKALLKHKSPVFLDEIGPVELKGQGFYKSLRNLLESRLELYLSTRTECLDEVIQVFHIKQYRLISHELSYQNSFSL